MKTHRQRFFAAVLFALLTSLGSLAALAQRARSDQAVSPDDQIITDDLVVLGRGCFGQTCENNEPFGNERLRLKAQSGPRLELVQVGVGSIPPQTWTIGGNEFFFYVADSMFGRTAFIIRPNALNDSLVVGTDGNIGLGTAAPVGKLHAVGAGNQLSIFQSGDNQAVQFRLQTNSTNRRFVALNAAGTQQSQLVFGDNGAFDFLGATASDVRMSLLGNGNASKPGGGSWATFSDERLKNIKGEFKAGLDALLQLQPIRYEYKADNAVGLKSEGEHVGFGAQEVRRIIPEAVTQNSDGYLMIDNDPILWTMLNAIKEQNAQMHSQNAELKAQLKAQGEQIARLEERGGDVAQLKEHLGRLQAQVVLQAGNRTLPCQPAVAEGNR